MKIIETDKMNFKVEESGTSQILHFAFLRAAAVNKNNRSYPNAVLAAAVGDLGKKLESAPAYGLAEHPLGEPALDRVSHLIQKVEMKGDEAWATIKLLPTRCGSNLQKILQAGGRVNVSSRGRGSLKKNEKGVDEVQPDFRLEGIDFTIGEGSAGFSVGPEAIFESALITSETVDTIQEKYLEAIRAGFRGSKEDYAKVWNELHESRAKEIGDLHQQSIDKSKTVPKAAPGFPKTYAPGNPQDGEEDKSDSAVAEKLLDAIKEGLSKLGMELAEVDENETVVFAFNMNESQYYKIPWTLLPDGQAQLGRPEPIEV